MHSLGLHVCACVHHSAISCRILFCTDHSNRKTCPNGTGCVDAELQVLWIPFHILGTRDSLNRFEPVVRSRSSKQKRESSMYYHCVLSISTVVSTRIHKHFPHWPCLFKFLMQNCSFQYVSMCGTAFFVPCQLPIQLLMPKWVKRFDYKS